MNPLQLALRVIRGDRRSVLSAVFTVFGVAIAVALITWLAAVPTALQARAEREAWRMPSYAKDPGQAAAVVNQTRDVINGRPIFRADMAVLKPGLTLPPGIPKAVGPGEVLLSPALAKLAGELPPEQLAQRFPGKVVGQIGDPALIYPDELVAVVGHAKEALSDQSGSPVTSLTGRPDPEPDPLLLILSRVGLVVLVVPSLVLVASAARLTAARRERRLAALRLAGATPGQVIATTAAEIGLAAAAGTAIGLAIGVPVRSLTSQLPWQGGTWFPVDLAPSWTLFALVAVLTPTLVVAAAVLGLRRVLSRPLGAAQQQTKKPPTAWRLVVPLVAAAMFIGGVFMGRTLGPMLMLAGLAGIALSATAVGPVLTSGIGRLFVKIWRRPSTLLAGRRLRDDPKAAFRASAGVVLAVFAGTLALVMLPSLESHIDSRSWRSWKEGVLWTDVEGPRAEQAAAQLRGDLGKLGVNTPVVAAPRANLIGPDGKVSSALLLSCADASKLTWMAIGPCDAGPAIWSGRNQPLPQGQYKIAPGGMDPQKVVDLGVPLTGKPVLRQMSGDAGKTGGTVMVDPALVKDPASLGYSTVAVLTSPSAENTVRTLMGKLIPGSSIQSLAQEQSRDSGQIEDLRRIAVIGLIIAGLLGGASAAITAAGSVVDRRRTFGALVAAGTPVKELAKALRTEAALPALVATFGAGAAGLAVAIGLLTMIEKLPAFNIWMATPAVVGIAVAALAASACGPLLRKVSARAYAEE